MNHPTTITRYLLLGAAFTLSWAGAAQAAPLEIVVEGLEAKGRLMIAAVDRAEAWDGSGDRLVSLDARVTGSKMSFRFEVPEGPVALRLFHDENGNGKLDRNLIGIPSEGYGFSNNPGGMGPASFEDAKVVVPAKGARVAIEIR